MAVPALMIAVGLLWGARALGRYLRLKAAWTSGVSAQANCLRAYVTTSGNRDRVRSTQHHVYEFTDRTGRPVRFEETNGPTTTVVGDTVVVHYPPDRPERATAIPPQGSGELARMVGTLVFLGVFIGVCVVFMVVTQSFFTTDEPTFTEMP
ncbi:DUF3592 domain-containing protein [Streptomyces sp. NPDC047108]|uniref:DUF3592 domain-containing protein n=1 Tax=Streptomyces sp. NPDC047108 TaxID=3155025 RepID=UPI0033CEA526